MRQSKYIRSSVGIALILAMVVGIIYLMSRELSPQLDKADLPMPAPGGVSISQSMAISITMEHTSSTSDHSHFPTIEARLMTYEQYKELDGNDSEIVEAITDQELDMAANPVWVVVYRTDTSLPRTDLYGGGARMPDLYQGDDGEAFVWPDGTSRGSCIIDANTGEILAWATYGVEATNQYLYDRVLAFPTTPAASTP